METEIKISFDSEDKLVGITKADWFSSYCLDTESTDIKELNNIYLDTPELDMRKKKASIRIRSYEKNNQVVYEHTIKYAGGVSNGLHQRYEWNVILDTDKFDIDNFKKGINFSSENDPEYLLDEVTSGINFDSLIPLCSTIFTRTMYTFGFGDSIMEACFDVGHIIIDSKKEKICELELELISGDVVDLKDMASFIVDNAGGSLFNESKFSRALKLMNNSDNA